MNAARILMVNGDAPATPADYVDSLYFDSNDNLRWLDADGVTHGKKTGSGTLTAGTTTTVTDAFATADSKIFLQATGSGFTSKSAYVSAKNAGSFVITHASAAGTETFDYIIEN